MIQLQVVYDQIAEAIRQRSTDPPEVQQLQEENKQRKQQLAELEKQLTTLKAELTEIRKKEGEWEVELEHFQKQKGMVTNEREFTAVISEIDYATKALEENRGRRGEIETEIENLHQDIDNRRAARPEEEAAQVEVVDSWDQRKNELKQQIHKLAVEASGIETKLTPNHRARFLRLLKSKRGTAISVVTEGSCSLCHFELRPHLQQRVRRCEELIACEHCHRILYFADQQTMGDEAT